MGFKGSATQVARRLSRVTRNSIHAFYFIRNLAQGLVLGVPYFGASVSNFDTKSSLIVP